MTAENEINETRQTIVRFGKFLVVGLLNTGFGYAVFALLVLAGLAPQIALALAFVIGVAWNYMFHARLVFNQGGFRGVPAYVGSYAAIYLFNAAGLAVLLHAGLPALWAQAILAPSAAVISFFLIARALTGKFPFAS